MTPAESLNWQLEQMRQLRMSMKLPKDVAYYGAEDLVLRHGRPYKLTPLPKRHSLTTWGKACFQNAYKAATRKNSPWIYVEGFAVPGGDRIGLAVNHAWLTRADSPGAAFDPTWDDSFDDSTAYMGIPIRREYVIEMHKKSKRQWYGVIDTFWAGWPLLCGDDKIEDVMTDEATRGN